MRGWLNDTRSYIEPVKIGEVMRASGVATVVATGPGSKFRVGDTVSGVVGWQEYAVVSDKLLQPAMYVIISVHMECILEQLQRTARSKYLGLPWSSWTDRSHSLLCNCAHVVSYDIYLNIPIYRVSLTSGRSKRARLSS
jgi:hypothetical protein